jgi:hypothetical protein
MTPDMAERLLDRFALRITSSFGFTRIDPLRYSCLKHDGIALLSFPLRLSSGGRGLFTVWVGLRFEPLAARLDDRPVDEMQPTFVQPIHFLHEDKKYTEWEFSDANDLDALSDAVRADLQRYALPFADRYSDLNELRKILESPDPKAWINIGIDVDRRVVILAAIQIVQGDRQRALKTLDDGLLERATAFPKRRFAIEYLRRRLLESGV